MSIQRILGVAVAAVAVTMTTTAIATAAPDMTNPRLVEANPADFQIGDTVYFSDDLGRNTCAIRSNGDVGCDLPGGDALWGVVPISDISIDIPFLPAHPTFGLGGRHGRADSRWITDVPRPDGIYQGTRISYAGATCIGGLPHGGQVSCTSKGHSFTLGSNAQIS